MDSFTDKMKQSVFLNEAFLLAEVLSNTVTLLQLIQVYPASGTIAERGFSLMNLIMDDFRNSMNTATLDATLRITYVYESTHDVLDLIIGIWKKGGNRRIINFNPSSKKKISPVFINIYVFMVI